MSKSKVSQYVMLEGVPQKEKIKDALRKLTLEAMSATLDDMNKRAIASKSTYLDFLESLIGNEFAFKEENRQNRWIQQARFPSLKTIKDFNFSIQKLEIDQRLIYELVSCRYIDEAKNVIFYGPRGVGKTHLAIALGLEAIQKGKEVKFLTLTQLIEMIEKLIANRGDTRYLLTALLRPKLLIIDDMENYSANPAVYTFLLSLIEHRYEKNSIMFTVNESFTKFNDLFGGEKRTGKIIERVFHHCYIVKLKGDSYRIRDKLKYLK